jgi:positive regulator of sigma E activity
MEFLGYEITRIAVVSAIVGAMFVGVGINLAGEIVKSIYAVLMKKRFERWLRKFDHHQTRVIRVLYKR